MPAIEEEYRWTSSEVADLITEMITSLCDHYRSPTVIKSQKEIIMSFALHPDDVGAVIGASGAMYKAIETFAKALATRNGYRISIMVEAEEDAL